MYMPVTAIEESSGTIDGRRGRRNMYRLAIKPFLSWMQRPSTDTDEFSGRPFVNGKLSICRFQQSRWHRQGAMLITVHNLEML
jgi:hypothetical protein